MAAEAHGDESRKGVGGGDEEAAEEDGSVAGAVAAPEGVALRVAGGEGDDAVGDLEEVSDVIDVGEVLDLERSGGGAVGAPEAAVSGGAGVLTAEEGEAARLDEAVGERRPGGGPVSVAVV